MKCGITGHTGNLGSVLIKSNKNIKFFKFNGDITNKNLVKKWINSNDFEYIVHLAAIVPTKKVVKKYKLAKKVNFVGTKNIIDSLLLSKKRISWFFFASTSHVYSFSKNKIKETNKIKPISKYGKTKLFAENYIRNKLIKNNIKFCIGRIFSIYDNKNSDFLISNLKKKMSYKKDKVILSNLNHFRDFVTTKYISKVIVFLMKKKINGLINIGSGRKTHLKKVAIEMANKYKKKIEITDNINPTTMISDISKLKRMGFKK
tara:strand:+ start:1 stop:780 length:780 start_codon:yes stop_codon:yes gene_type:complete